MHTILNLDKILYKTLIILI